VATDAASEEAPASPDAAAAGETAGPVDERRQAWLEALRRELGDALLGHEIAGGDMWVRVDAGAWCRAALACRDRLGCDYFCFLSGLDWKSDVDLAGEKVWDPAPPASMDAEAGSDGRYRTGVAGGETRFQVFARLFSTGAKMGITLKSDLRDEDPRVESLVPLYRGADWHEREAWEMFGFTFEGHPGLRHLYLPGEFEGNPLRKDFPLLSREVKPWPGLVDVEAMPGEPESGAEAEAEGEGGDS
jgi:NADH-quinone oxidoreductase subunit C